MCPNRRSTSMPKRKPKCRSTKPSFKLILDISNKSPKFKDSS